MLNVWACRAPGNNMSQCEIHFIRPDWNWASVRVHETESAGETLPEDATHRDLNSTWVKRKLSLHVFLASMWTIHACYSKDQKPLKYYRWKWQIFYFWCHWSLLIFLFHLKICHIVEVEWPRHVTFNHERLSGSQCDATRRDFCLWCDSS